MWTGGVDWTIVNDLVDTNHLSSPYIPIGTNKNWDDKTTLNLDTLSSYLANYDFILAMVGNRHADGTLRGHWVIINEKKDTIYNISDAGRCDGSRPTLTSYDNKIYRAIIYKRR